MTEDSATYDADAAMRLILRTRLMGYQRLPIDESLAIEIAHRIVNDDMEMLLEARSVGADATSATTEAQSPVAMQALIPASHPSPGSARTADPEDGLPASVDLAEIQRWFLMYAPDTAIGKSVLAAMGALSAADDLWNELENLHEVWKDQPNAGLIQEYIDTYERHRGIGVTR